jgi:hypothetical protein
MPWTIAVFVVLLVLALITVCTINAVRIIRHMNRTVAMFRERLENDANSVVDSLFKAHHGEDGSTPSANGSQSMASE